MRNKFILVYIIIAAYCSTLYGTTPDIMDENKWLLQLHQDDDKKISEACVALSKNPKPIYIQEVKPLLKHHSQLVRHSAAHLLASIGGPDIEKLFFELSDSSSPDNQRIALIGLSRIHSGENAYQLIVRKLQSSYREVREAAVMALGLLGDQKAIQVLLNDKKIPIDFEDTVKNSLKQLERCLRWYSNYEEAVSFANKTKKPIFILFYIPDNQWNRKILSDFSSDERLINYFKDFVCIKANVWWNNYLVEKWNVSGVPFMIFLDSNGDIVGSFKGYGTSQEIVEQSESYYMQNDVWQKDYQKCNDLLDNGQYSSAIAILERLHHQPGFAGQTLATEMLFALGYAYGQVKKYLESNQIFDELFTSYQNFSKIDKARYCYALNLLGQNKVNEAKNYFYETKKLYPASDLIPYIDRVLEKIDLDQKYRR